jgi:hypothetical protein
VTVPSSTPQGIFLGYLARKPWKPEPSWDPEGKTGVIEACSVSDCMCERPPDWVQRWDYNRATCHDTVEAARDAIPLADREAYAVFAYWLIPPADARASDVAYAALDITLPPLPESPGPADFELLGHDVVGLAPFLPPFGHSPLTCNLTAREVPVNRWCLIDELERARDLAARWSAADGDGVEPGTYYVVRVARERPAG